jgi:3'-phosphoadenosine 5'-phosphosulfate sulfotransferase (PAPS reductase)/FAD synthetase
MENENAVISFSGGRTSAYMTIKLLETGKYNDAHIIFSNTGKENEATLVFVHEMDRHLQTTFGKAITWLEYNPDPDHWFNVVSFATASREGEPFAALIGKRNYCPNRVARFCTQDLKIRPIKKYCQRVLGWKHWVNLVGIRYDEPRRWNKSKSVERNEVFDVEHPLVKWRVTKPQVLEYFQNMPFDLELKEHEGNCDLCFLKGKKKKQAIARETPEKFDWWIAQEKKIGGTFTPDYSYEQLRLHVINSPQFDFDDSIECFCNTD